MDATTLKARAEVRRIDREFAERINVLTNQLEFAFQTWNVAHGNIGNNVQAEIASEVARLFGRATNNLWNVETTLLSPR